jgi:hypothetical protein
VVLASERVEQQELEEEQVKPKARLDAEYPCLVEHLVVYSIPQPLPHLRHPYLVYHLSL